MTQLHRINVKVTIQGDVIYPLIFVRSISPKPFELVLFNCIQMLLSVKQSAEHMNKLPRLKVKVTGQGFTLDFRVRSISLEPLRLFSINFTQIFLLVRNCTEPITGLHRLKVKVTI